MSCSCLHHFLPIVFVFVVVVREYLFINVVVVLHRVGVGSLCFRLGWAVYRIVLCRYQSSGRENDAVGQCCVAACLSVEHVLNILFPVELLCCPV